jgi:hypothetical protein
MSVGDRAAFRLAATLLLAAVASAARGQPGEPLPSPGDSVGVYVVQPGDTLERITEKLLGDRDLWPENWRLNPEVRDPERLRIGQRLRVITHRVLPQRKATVARLARRVDEKPHPDPWRPAEVGSVLREKDGVRTYERSSAELAFDDGSVLTLTEDSLVFLREMTSSVAGVKRQSVEVVEGQADLDARPRERRTSDIEIVMGGATLKPELDASRKAQARARRSGGGGAQVMVYAGRGAVEAGGATVSVPAGSGTSVPAAGPPRPPERLLASPRLLGPRPGSAWDFANPPFAWTSVRGAASYTVEVCADAPCGTLRQRVTGLTATTWAPPALPVGELFWRATAVAESGLDGYPSAASPLTIRSDQVDVESPVIAVRIDGACAPGADGSILLGRGARLLVDARDDAAGVDRLEGRWDGGRWQPIAGDVFEPPGDAAPHTFELRAVDRLGRAAAPLSGTVRRLVTPPSPPSVRVDAEAAGGR